MHDDRASRRRWVALAVGRVLLALLALSIVACTSATPAATPGLNDQGGPGAPGTAAAEGSPLAPVIPGVPDIGDIIPSFPLGSILPETASQVTATVRGQVIRYPFVATCEVSTDRVAIYASDQGGTGGISLQWLAADPTGTVATLSNVSAAGGFVLTREDDHAVPHVSVQGDAAQLQLEVVETAFGNRDPEMVTVTATCIPPAEVTEPPEPTAVSAGRATLRIGDQTFEFSFAETCVIDQDQVTAQFDEGDRILTIVASGGAAFMNVTVAEKNWSVGLTGDPMEFQVSGSSATWSGEVSGLVGGTSEAASVTVECNQ